MGKKRQPGQLTKSQANAYTKAFGVTCTTEPGSKEYMAALDEMGSISKKAAEETGYVPPKEKTTSKKGPNLSWPR